MNGGTAIIIIAVIILIVGAFISLHFWFHVFFVLPEAAVTSTSTPLNSEVYAAFVGSPMSQETSESFYK
jgi:hypothetical protein